MGDVLGPAAPESAVRFADRVMGGKVPEGFRGRYPISPRISNDSTAPWGGCVPQPEMFQVLAVATGLGLLVGLQRQWAADDFAGIRTFPLIAVLGSLAAILDGDGFSLQMVGLASVALMMMTANLVQVRAGKPKPGITTEVAALVVYLIGIAVAQGFALPAVVAAGGTTVLLHWKAQLHGVVEHLGEDEVRAIVRLVLIGLVVLPILPDQAYGPYDVLNPFRIWRMVVLIVGISLAAYTAYQVFGGRAGTLLAGVLGGLISSTATTVSYANQSRQGMGSPGVGATIIIVASTAVIVRVLLEIAVVHSPLLQQAAPPLLALMAFMFAVATFEYRRVRRSEAPEREEHAPSDLTAAVTFGLLYAVILYAVAWAQDAMGGTGLYVVAGLSGLTDVDAITLSLTQFVQEGQLAADQAWRLILFANLANMVFKAGAVVMLASSALRRRVVPLFAVSVLAGTLILLFWGGGSGLVS